VGRAPGDVVGPLARGVGGELVICMSDIFILNEIWVQDKVSILVATFLG
jgi:hypothetical protein